MFIVMKLITVHFFPTSYYFVPLRSKYSPQHPVTKYPQSVVGIGTGYGLDDSGLRVRVPVGSRILFSTSSRPTLGLTQLPIKWVLGALSSRVKRPGREADH
jgi:hypothetical protein